jgi:hypothetical protein
VPELLLHDSSTKIRQNICILAHYRAMRWLDRNVFINTAPGKDKEKITETTNLFL